MTNMETPTIEMHDSGRYKSVNRFGSIIITVVTILILSVLAISIAILIRVNQFETTTPTTTSQPTTLSAKIQVGEAMEHLRALEALAASTTGGNRAVNTPGFDKTLDYIITTLQDQTDFRVNRSTFFLRNFIIGADPVLVISIDNTPQSLIFSTNLDQADFFYAQYSRPTNLAEVPISVIPDVGCNENDWKNLNPSPSNRVALVKRGNCTFIEKASFASQFNVAALLFYNDGDGPGRMSPIFVSLGDRNELPALFLSYKAGKQLADAANDPNQRVRVRMTIDVRDQSRFPVDNICADTPTGDPTQTIVVGAHSDSVEGGPGINDNGSGSAAILAMAAALSRLYLSSSYPRYKYRVRFCWWGAEERGLLGSDYHVRQASESNDIGERLSDYLINLNYDMLASPNFMFGIYDAKTAPSNTPPQARTGNQKTTDLFVDWFKSQGLPWDYTDFSGRSDYGPFLARGIVAGGLFTGADEMKMKEQRDRYASILGEHLGGIAGAIQDPCYHQACDSIGNINKFAFEKMLQAAGYVLEQLGRQDDLKTWLYPSNDLSRSARIYDSITEYFKFPYA